ncbi:MAG: hypothetical protein LWW94_08585 [Candidatus Desulfofervidaceae bacterium]|nr:hypothetical protein [Candidatus Desulfofervidaceae bacterium]
MQKLSELLKDYDDKDYRIDILRYVPQSKTLTIDGEELVLVALKHYSIGQKGKLALLIKEIFGYTVLTNISMIL